MPELLHEMRKDILSDNTQLVREIVILPFEGVIFNSTKIRFVYFENKHDKLIDKVKLLEEYGLLIDVTPLSTPIYRMVDEFIELLTTTNLDSIK